MNSPEEMVEINSAAQASGGGDSASEGRPVGEQHESPLYSSSEMSEEDWLKFQETIPADDPKHQGVVVREFDWKKELLKIKVKDKETQKLIEVPDQKCHKNIYLTTRYHESLRGIFILNEFSGRKCLVKSPPWENARKFRVRDVRDDDFNRICMELETLGMKPSVDKVAGAIESICHDRSFHPVQNYFKKLEWDGEKRLQTWLGHYLGATHDDAVYLAGVGKKWLTAGVARIMNPGCKFDHMLVLEGTTDIGKSEVFRKLSTFNGISYFYDGMTFAKIGDKDTMQNIQGSLIIEFPEMSSLQSREVEEVKQWITIQEDRGRKPYGREPVMFPRQFILAGSTNNEEYLRDNTGNKRFWPVMCGDKLKLSELERDREQLWAEAVHLYKSGFKYWIPEGDELIALSRHAQKKRLVTHPWLEAIMDYIEGKDRDLSISRILQDAVGKKLEHIKKSDEMIVAGILKSNGYERNSGGKKRVWNKKITQAEMQYEASLADMTPITVY